MKSRLMWSLAVAAGVLTVAVGVLAGCHRAPVEEATPTPIPYSTDLYQPTPFPGQAAAPTPAPAAKKSAGTVSQPAYTPSRQEMETALNDYGDWVSTPEYGRVWTPRAVPATWRPYQNGRWVNSDGGWLWQAREPWGWLPYHYGHWTEYPRYGWVWVPGTTWVPAQVAWRANDQYVAWAPVPPGPRVDVSVIPPSAWVVVPAPRFLEVQLSAYIVPPVRVAPVLVSIPPVVVTRPAGPSVYYVGPQVTVVNRWVRQVPPPVRVETWRYEVPYRYRAHYDRGYHEGWYRPAGAPPPPRPRGATIEVERRGLIAPPPPRGVSVEYDRRGPARTEVEVRGPAGRTQVEIDRRGNGRGEVEVEHRGPVGHGEVEVERHGRGRGEVEAERHGPAGRTEVEVERHGRGHSEVEIEHQGRHGRGGEVEVERHGKKVEVEVDRNRPARRIEVDVKHK